MKVYIVAETGFFGTVCPKVDRNGKVRDFKTREAAVKKCMLDAKKNPLWERESNGNLKFIDRGNAIDFNTFAGGFKRFNIIEVEL